jgi:AcrR family transcriptional regulator
VSSRREQRRQLQQDLSRAQLLDAAEEVFGRKGFHDTTLKEIAELAEFSVGSVSSFFENKDDLFLSVFLRRGEEFLPGMRAAVQEAGTDGGTALEQLDRLVDFEVGFFRAHPFFGRLYLRGSELPPSSTLEANFEAAMEIHAGIFRQGQREGTLRDGDPLALGRLLSGLVAAFQAIDPAVMSDDPKAGERLPLDDLHTVVRQAFSP